MGFLACDFGLLLLVGAFTDVPSTVPTSGVFGTTEISFEAEAVGCAAGAARVPPSVLVPAPTTVLVAAALLAAAATLSAAVTFFVDALPCVTVLRSPVIPFAFPVLPMATFLGGVGDVTCSVLAVEAWALCGLTAAALACKPVTMIAHSSTSGASARCISPVCSSSPRHLAGQRTLGIAGPSAEVPCCASLLPASATEHANNALPRFASLRMSPTET